MITQRILELLDRKDLTMADLCRFIGINTSTMANWKTRNTDPPAKLLIPICEFLDVTLEFLLTGENQEKEAISSGDDRLLSDSELRSTLDRYIRLNADSKIKAQAYMIKLYEEESGDGNDNDSTSWADVEFRKTGTNQGK